MRLLDRYLLRELLLWLGGCVACFLMFWVAFDLMQQLNRLLDARLSWGEIAAYYFILAPKFLIIALPIGLLLALLFVLTNLARHNEIVAMRSAGISLWRLAAPFFAVGLTCSLALFAINELLVPDSIERAEHIRNSHLPNPPRPEDRLIIHNLGFNNDREGRDWQIGTYNVKNSEMTRVQVQMDRSRWQLFAERAVFTNRAWLFFDAHVYTESAAAGAPLTPLLQTNALFMANFTETPEAIRAEIKMNGRLGDLSTKEVDVPVSEIRNYLRLHPDPPLERRHWLYTELQGRLAAPWVCLMVVLIALPFGARSGRRNVFVGVASAIFIVFGFFVLQQIGLAMGAGGFIPAWVAGWLPIFVFGGAGLWLTDRVR
jgi:lipopolysaccharide export system permease protein